MPLALLGVGESGTITDIRGKEDVIHHLHNLGFAAMDMGLTKGTSVYVRKVAPLGDPIEVTVRGYELSLRKADAELIEVQ